MADQSTSPFSAKDTPKVTPRREYNPDIFKSMKALDDYLAAKAIAVSQKKSHFQKQIHGMSAAIEQLIDSRHSQLVERQSYQQAAKPSARFKSAESTLETRRWLESLPLGAGRSWTERGG